MKAPRSWLCSAEFSVLAITWNLLPVREVLLRRNLCVDVNISIFLALISGLR